jgi:hypothetical protein
MSHTVIRAPTAAPAQAGDFPQRCKAELLKLLAQMALR